MPVSARRQLFELTGDMATRINVLFYSDTPDALLKGVAGVIADAWHPRVVAACYHELRKRRQPIPSPSRNWITMKIENSFEVPVSASEAWAMLMNIEEVVGCLPGAQLGEVVTSRPTRGRSRRGSAPSPSRWRAPWNLKNATRPGTSGG